MFLIYGKFVNREPVIHHLLSHGYYYCVYDLYQGCQTRGSFLVGVRNYCCICRVSNHYSIHDLNIINKDFLKLSKYHYDILGNIAKVKKMSDNDNDFWDDEVEYKYSNHETGTESPSFLIDSIEFFYSF